MSRVWTGKQKRNRGECLGEIEGQKGLPGRRDSFSNDMEVGNSTMCIDSYLHWTIIYEIRKGC